MKSHITIHAILLALTLAHPVGAAVTESAPLDSEVAACYEQTLLRSPRKGVAFDRVVEWYSTTGGGLDVLDKRWAESGSDLARGLLAERRRDIGLARELYRKALDAGGGNIEAAVLLSALEATEGNFPDAIAVLERALQSDQIPQPDRLDMMRSLALLHQRNFALDKAADVWRDALWQFPGETDLTEDAGEAFLEADLIDDARRAFEQLAIASNNDPFRKLGARLRLAEVEERAEKIDTALAIYTTALDDSSPGSWINRDIRRRVQDLFVRRNDLPGLVDFLNKRLKDSPRDHQSATELAEAHFMLGKNDEAIAALRRAVEMAPGDIDLRLRLIRALEENGDPEGAMVLARELPRPKDASAETLILLGRLLHKTNRDEALQVWRRLAPDDSKEAAAIVRLAETLEQNSEIELAITEWRRLLSLDPTAIDARLRLATLLVERGTEAEAVTLLAEPTTKPESTPDDHLTRIRTLDKLKLPEATENAIGDALGRFPDDPDILGFAWRRVLEKEGASDRAWELIDSLWKHVQNDFRAADIIKRQIGAVPRDALADFQPRAPHTDDELGGALLLQAGIALNDQEKGDAGLAILRKSAPPARLARAVVDHASEFLGPDERIAALEQLAMADPKTATDTLRKIARIQAETGRSEKALESLATLIAQTPTDGSLVTEYADLAASTGRATAAMDALQRGIRVVTNPQPLRYNLSEMLVAEGRMGEAETVLREAFESATTDATRMEAFRRQAQLARQSGRIDDLIADLREKQRREREGGTYALYLAEVFVLLGDQEAARMELERRLTRDPRNTALISRMIALCDESGNSDEAIRLAERLAELKPGPAAESDFIVRLLEGGRAEEALPLVEKRLEAIIAAPEDWQSVLGSLGSSGQKEMRDRIARAVADRAGDNPVLLEQAAMWRLAELDISGAEELLWRAVDLGDPISGLVEIAAAGPQGAFQPGVTMSAAQSKAYWARTFVQGLVRAGEQWVRNANPFQSMGGIRHRFPSAVGAIIPASVAPERIAAVRALFALAHIAEARGAQTTFIDRLTRLEGWDELPIELEIALYHGLNQSEKVKAIIREIAEDDSLVGTDAMLLEMRSWLGEEVGIDFARIEQRYARLDKAYAIGLAFRELVEKVASMTPDSFPDPAISAEIKRIREMAVAESMSDAFAHLYLTALANKVKDLDAAVGWQIEFLHSFESAFQPPKSGRRSFPGSAFTRGFHEAWRKSISDEDPITAAMTADHPRALELLEKSMSHGAKSLREFVTKGASMGILPLMQFLQPQGVKLFGHPDFPVQILTSHNFMGNELVRDWPPVLEWLEKHQQPDVYGVLYFSKVYVLWLSGKKEEALALARAAHQEARTPGTAAVLFELLEQFGKADEALALIETAALQPGEDNEVRLLRKCRLLIAANRMDEARKIAKGIVAKNSSSRMQYYLSSEFSTLGIQSANTASSSRRSYSFQSRSTAPADIYSRVQKLTGQNKKDEAL